ncbi:adhesion G-protein coupled receptor G5-like [Seriola lalandi dorsalis]|uniref:Adhesion G protein-coupled receptor G1 n=1 Tax=Seriola lalandi dorsalis TaxID=1841481 RepID=A0A3B4XMX7_SERLL|nr:adhesion G-protein coupled receptor G5-like [Seriola lalandi dorsalis]
MEPRLTDSLSVVFILSILLSTGSSESDRDLKFCGIWRHGKNFLSLSVNLSPGCSEISISANTSSLSIDGKITSQCQHSDVIPLRQFGLESEEEIRFCLHWEPLLDHFRLQLGETTLNLCRPSSLQRSCCTYLSDSSGEPEAPFGIINGTVRTDFITNKTRSAYKFKGESIDCKHLCAEEINGPTRANMIKEEDSCTRSIEVEMKDDFRGSNFTSPVTIGSSAELTTTVHVPPALKQAAKGTNKVHCTFFQNISLFQEVQKKIMILTSVVEITVENEVIIDLSEPIRIGFHHDPIPKKHSRRCVSWDTRKDPYQVNWLVDGCVTQQKGEEHTECFCNHLTYFSVLVQMEPRPVRHLLALTVITSVGCIVSAISCVALIIFLYRKRRSQEQSIPIHLGLAVSLLLLCLLFFFTGILANMGGEGLCTWVGAGLHYSLLISFSWMGIEVFHTFWLVYMVFSPLPKGIWKLWSLVGFGLPAVPVIILATVGNIYGLREVVPSDDVSNPYLMCWMKSTYKALLAHYFTTMTILVILVSSGIVMLFLVYRKIQTRDEWRQGRVAFLSIWGLSCLFGTTWGLTFLDFGPLSDFVLFLSCILNSFQGFLLMLRFYMLEWIRKQAGGSALGSNSTGSTRQQMLQAQEKS